VAVGLDDIVRRHRSPEDEEDVARVNRPLQPALSNTLLEGPQRLLPIALKYPDSGQAYKIPGTARRVSPPALAFAGNLTGQLSCPLGLPALLQRPGETEHAGDPEPRCFGQAPLEVMPRRVQITHSERMFARDDQRLRAMPDAPPLPPALLWPAAAASGGRSYSDASIATGSRRTLPLLSRAGFLSSSPTAAHCGTVHDPGGSDPVPHGASVAPR
jgi:hypothetical protein